MLPEPDSELIAQSRQLQQLIAREIQQHDGWIGFDHFMDLALYAPDLGYYRSALEKFGEQGDFVTAPLLGDLFGRCIARQCAQVIVSMENASLYEFGAGDGSLAVAVITELDKLGALPDCYYIMETSAGLKQRQRSSLEDLNPELKSRVKWMDQLPDAINGVVVGNELLDAMPCKRFEVDAHGKIHELGVCNFDARFGWGMSSHLMSNIDWLRKKNLGSGYQSELPMQAAAWVSTVGEKIDQGIMLLIDYGFPRQEFYHPDRNQGTLMCHYRHYAHTDPFFWPGLQDITTHIDFTAIAEAGAVSGLRMLGFCDQANFLLSCGLTDILADSQTGSDPVTKEILKLNVEVKKLTMPHEMGELFKVIAMGKEFQENLVGFQTRNQVRRLSPE